jgi:hypothetical protein
VIVVQEGEKKLGRIIEDTRKRLNLQERKRGRGNNDNQEQRADGS